MSINIETTDTASLKYGVKTLVYGLSGHGKTRLSASAPKPIILSAERGLLSLRDFKIPFINITSLATMREAYNFLLNNPNFHTIILDSISEIAELCLEDEKRRNRDGRKAYGEMQDEILAEFRKFRDMQYRHVVFLAKQEGIVDQATGSRLNRPMFPGSKLGEAAPYFFDEVWQINRFKDQTTGKPYWLLRCHPDNNNQAKDRSGSLEEWENADPATGGGLTVLFNKMLARAA